MLGLALSDLQLDAFERFEDALYAWNQRKNLTRVPREECWIRHFLDSLLFHDLLPQAGKVLDLGTGPGFPAWPLAQARPDLSITALDSNGRMLDFLRTQPLPNLRVVQRRAEEFGEQGFDVVTGRAVAPLAAQVEVSARPCRIGGSVIPMRTGSDDPPPPRAVAKLGLTLVDVIDRTLPITGAKRRFPVLKKVVETPKGYPRTWSAILRQPLF